MEIVMAMTKINSLARLWSLGLVVIAGLVLAGCVTSGIPETHIDKKQALATYIQMGEGYLRNKNRESARHHFNKALAIDEKSAGALNGLALLYQIEGESELAEQNFRAAIKADSKFSQSRNNYGSFLFQRQRYQEAYEQFELASEDLTYRNRPMALYNLGRAALQRGNVGRAQAALEHSLNLRPQLSHAMIELAEIHFNNQSYAEAKKYLDAFAKVSRNTARSLWLGIRIERIFGNSDKEASYLLALKNLYPYLKEYLAYKNNNKN